MSGTLWLVATPIGNLGDLSDRARETLRSVDLIAAEDTRRTGRLLSSFGLGEHAPMLSYFEGNERERTSELVGRLSGGADVALVTDGGMPGVSDPGYRLVRAAIDAGVQVHVVPGPSSVLAALVLSGLPMHRFAFEGFLPRKAGDRRARLEALGPDDRTLVLFESPRRVQTLLREILDAWGDRRVAVARELTKLHEEVRRGPISQVLAEMGEAAPKGEVVVVVQGRTGEAGEDLAACVSEAEDLVAGGMKKRDAARAVADRHAVSANAIYRSLLG